MESYNLILTQIKERLKLGKSKYGELVDPTNFRRMIESLWYLTSIRPDIIVRVGLVSIFIVSMSVSLASSKPHILQYIKIMQSDGIFYTYYNKIEPIGYTDSDWAVDIEKQKRPPSYMFNLSLGVFSFIYLFIFVIK